MNPTEFIARWQHASGSELANAQSFVRELAELLELPPPNPGRFTETTLADHIPGKGSWKKRLPDLPQTLVALGRARQEGETWMVV